MIFLSTSPLRGTTRGLVPSIQGSRYFYPRPPCGGRHSSPGTLILHFVFLSTSPLRGTTCSPARWILTTGYFYPRPPCGGRRKLALYPTTVEIFLSTSPLRGTTNLDVCALPENAISIHVPLAGDDIRNRRSGRFRQHFYPRPPCGGRLSQRRVIPLAERFLSTSPLRGTTTHNKHRC